MRYFKDSCGITQSFTVFYLKFVKIVYFPIIRAYGVESAKIFDFYKITYSKVIKMRINLQKVYYFLKTAI